MKKILSARFTSTILAMVFTIITCLIVLYNSHQGAKIAKYYSPLIDAAMEVKLEAAIAHLWFEEIVSGDSTISYEKVMMHIDESIWYTNAMLHGDENAEGRFLPIEDATLRKKIKETQASLKIFRSVAEERWLNKINSGIGSDIDQKFDKIFYEFIDKADAVETELQGVMKTDQKHFAIMQYTLLFFILVMGVITSFVYYRNEKKQKQFVDKLNKSSANLRSLLDNREDAIWSLDRNYNYIIFNKSYEKVILDEYGIKLEMGMNALEIQPAEIHEFWKSKYEPVFRGENNSFEFTHKLNGTIQHFQLTLNPIITDGIVAGASAFSINITKRKHAEELLHKSKNRIRTKLNAILLPEGNLEVLSLDEILDVPAIRGIMENIFNLTGIAVALADLEGNDLIQFGWQDICTKYHRTQPISCQNCLESDTALASQAEPGKFNRYKCKNNLWDMASPIHVDGRHVGFIFIGQFFFKDETPELTKFKRQAKLYGFNETEYLLALKQVPRVSKETVEALACFYTQFSAMISNLSYSSIKFAKIVGKQKQSENKIKQLNAELENRVNRGTSELENKSKDLIDSQNALLNIVEDLNEKTELLEKNTAALEAVNKELESFSYSVSHDLRAPLRGIDGFSLALLEDYGEILDEQGKGYLNRVRKGTQKMALLIDDMLSLSRLGRKALKPTTVNLSKIAQSICNDFSEHDLQRSAEIIIAKDISCIADPTLIRAVLQNLFENAWKFTSKKAITKIEFAQIDCKGKITYIVKDNGAGFEMNYAKKLFKPFQRLHQTSEFPGTGIGLATVQRIIHRHNGELWAESEIDKGATFYFTLNA